MLQNLKDILVANGYFFEDELRNVDSSPCTTSTIQVVNMDKIKEKACNDFGIGQYPKSSDLLLLKSDKNELHIIEMKRTATQKASEFCSTFNNSTVFREKNVHSIFLLLSLASHFNIDKAFFAFFFNAHPKELRIRTSVLCDLPDSEMPFVFLSKINTLGVSFCQIIAGDIEVINCNTFQAYFA